jgi:glucose-6-phosphate isomerase
MMSDLTSRPEWHALQAHRQTFSNVHLRELFRANPERFQDYSLEAAGLLLDYSKNQLTEKTIPLLCELAKASKLSTHIERLFNAEPVNFTEHSAALHTALRQPKEKSTSPNQDAIHRVFEKMRDVTERIRNQRWLGCQNQPITDIVNIGIGGSDLGPAMVTEALTPYMTNKLRCHFVSNVDGSHISEILKPLNPTTTLFIISSKSFTTLETMTNANTAMQWMRQSVSDANLMSKHFIAVTANSEKAIAFGIYPENIFELWPWVGGRYSLWSAIGLPIALAIGMEHFQQLLAGAYEMDQHFRTTPFEKNMPVLLALLGIWYINFFGAQTHAILPYDHYLRRLPAYLQQTDMESNGKRVRFDGTLVDYATGPIIWGEVGCNGQHAFHQLLHQGTHFTPVDFIIPCRSHHAVGDHHALLFANYASQAQALMQGKTTAETIAELEATGMSRKEAEKLAPHKTIPGNRPSNSILLPQLTPSTLGALLALYEHKIFVQGIIWGINSFDQWGIELGKQIANTVLPHLQKNNVNTKTPQSLLDYYHAWR